jgi:hypothetical protein
MALRGCFQLKESWKFASSPNRLGKYYFSHAEYQVARIEYERDWGTQPSPFDKILVSLSSEFKSRQELLEAESIIEGKIEKFIEAYRKDPETPSPLGGDGLPCGVSLTTPHGGGEG